MHLWQEGHSWHSRGPRGCYRRHMCRNIKLLFNFEPPATDEEIAGAALQYVRKVSGARKPSRRNQAAFDRAVEEVAAATRQLLVSFETDAPKRDREEEARKAKEKWGKREALAAARD